MYSLGGYQRISNTEEQRSDTPSPCSSKSHILCSVPLFAFVAGALFSLIATLPFLIKNKPYQEKMPTPVIPIEVFSPKIPTAWVPDERYIGYSKYTNLQWHHLVQTTESVWITNPSEHSLGGGFEAQFNHSSKSELPSQFYHISNLHQLHCLNIIRGRYFELYYNTPSLSKQSETAAEETRYHVDHCIEYLRMTIMCGGSWDIESNSPPGTPDELKTDPFGHPIGWGGIRNCVNWNALMTWQKKQLEKYMKT